VLGWYNKNNWGDEAFKFGLHSLFPIHTLKFSDNYNDLKDSDAILIGGGSVFPNIIKSKIDIPYALIGIDIPKNLNKKDMEFLDNAKFILARSGYYKNSTICPDIVHSLSIKTIAKPKKHILIFLNSFQSSKQNSPDWHIRGFDWFNCEFSQAIDEIIQNTDLNIVFAPLCINKHEDDRRASAPVVDRIIHKDRIEWRTEPYKNFWDIILDIEQADIVISSRLHGLVFSSLVGTPFIGLNVHDKIRFFCERSKSPWIKYYGFLKGDLFDARTNSQHELLNFSRKEKDLWKDMQEFLNKELFS
jgi:polysaccharide pyruvyl transferase WcaK-like protein